MYKHSKRVIIHIGTEKTGTTSIQFFLWENRHLLAKNGIGISSLSTRRRIPIALLAYDQNRSDDLSKSKDLFDGGDRREFLQYFKDEFIYEIRRSKISKWIISSEYLHSRLTTVEEILKFKEFLEKIFAEISIIIYLRRPIDVAISLWSTGVKSGHYIPTLPYPDNKYWDNLCNHKATIERWEQVFPENITYRLYLKEEFKDSELIKDFCHFCNIPDDSYVYSNIENKALSWKSLLILNQINKINKPFKYDYAITVNLFSYLERQYSSFGKYRPTEEEVLVYLNHYKDSNEWVRSRYFPHLDELFDNYPKEKIRDCNEMIQSLSEEEIYLIEIIQDLLNDQWEAKHKQKSIKLVKILVKRFLYKIPVHFRINFKKACWFYNNIIKSIFTYENENL